MTEDTGNTPHDEAHSCRHRLGRKTRFGIAAAGLIGLGAILGGLGTVAVDAGAHGGFGFSGHRHWRGRGPLSQEQMLEGARDKAAWMLGSVDATPEQESQVDAILSKLIADVHPLRQQHRGNRREFISELLRTDVDRTKLEQIRRSEVELMDTGSAILLDALLQTSNVLNADQREELLSKISRRFRR